MIKSKKHYDHLNNQTSWSSQTKECDHYTQLHSLLLFYYLTFITQAISEIWTRSKVVAQHSYTETTTREEVRHYSLWAAQANPSAQTNQLQVPWSPTRLGNRSNSIHRWTHCVEQPFWPSEECDIPGDLILNQSSRPIV